MSSQVTNTRENQIQRAAQVARTPGGTVGGGSAGSSSAGVTAPTLTQAATLSATNAATGNEPTGDGTNGNPYGSRFPFILGDDELGNAQTYLVVQGRDIEYSF